MYPKPFTVLASLITKKQLPKTDKPQKHQVFIPKQRKTRPPACFSIHDAPVLTMQPQGCESKSSQRKPLTATIAVSSTATILTVELLTPMLAGLASFEHALVLMCKVISTISKKIGTIVQEEKTPALEETNPLAQDQRSPTMRETSVIAPGVSSALVGTEIVRRR
ncbi:hypothetical protein F53441_1444 [Fusarium austroafricanum]|uniref:Uncharacterized protein n=1 Tax=Fusarium austroafricanum TaxID=2364996 RepID=A0A8H4KUL5_9HYPO|nr:hypothetical protein F53441_1444 [Fusarium austroafricanum]